MPDAVRITLPPRHHFFGFHDLVAWNAAGDKLLSLEVDDISHPPYPGDRAAVGYVKPDTHTFVPLGWTSAFNYPQGARQQWIGATDRFVANDRVGNRWGARIYDAASGEVAELAYPVHCLARGGGEAFAINYARLHRLGGYGYVGLPDPTAAEAAPAGDGIVRHCLRTGQAELLVSLREVSEHDASAPPPARMSIITSHTRC